jgi:hypothetical protein
LQHPVRVANDKIPLVIISCCILHNVAKYLKHNLPNDDEVQDLLEENDEDNDEDNEEMKENQREDLHQRGQDRRREIQNIMSVRGNKLVKDNNNLFSLV